jgi:arabinose operon protein AraL
VSVLFLSNKAIDRRSVFSTKLNDLGVPADESAVINSASITANYLSKHHPDDAIFVVGEQPLSEELADAALHLTTDPAETDVLLASMDRTFDYETLTDALDAMDGDTTFLATNPDRTCPIEGGEIPDCAAMVGAIEGATGETLDRVLGKPSQTTVDAATDALGVPLERCLMIGDRLETDIAMGERAGMTTVLVLSGVTDRTTLADSDVEPDYVLESIADIDKVIEAC